METRRSTRTRGASSAPRQPTKPRAGNPAASSRAPHGAEPQLVPGLRLLRRNAKPPQISPKEARATARRARAAASDLDTFFLQHKKVRAPTERVYSKAAEEFVTWATRKRLKLTEQHQRDLAMSSYVHSLYFNGEGIASARYALYGYAHCHVLNMRDPKELALARKALAGYRAVAPDQQRDPCPWEAVLLIVAELVAQNDPVCLEAARASAISFEAYTRPSELLGTRCRDVILVEGSTVVKYPSVCLRIAPFVPELHGVRRATKSGEYDDTVVLGDAVSQQANRGWVATLVAALTRSKSPDDPLVALSLAQWETCFALAVRNLGLEKLRITHTTRRIYFLEPLKRI